MGSISMDPTLHLRQPATLYIPSPLHPAAYTRAKELGFHILFPEDIDPSTDWQANVDAIALRQGHVGVDFAKSPKLRIIARNGTGYDMIDLAKCKSNGIAVTNLPGFNAEAVAEHCVALVLALTRRVPETMRHMRQGKALRSVNYIGMSLNGKVLGLVGMGNIARETARKFIGAFNCKVLVYSPTSPADRWTSQDIHNGHIPHDRVSSLQALLQRADVVSLHAPATPETRNMISTAELDMMKSTAVLLNLGRGELVDEAALYKALKENQIHGAALDVFCEEPATTIRYGELFDLDNVVFTPHTGATTLEVTRDSTIKAVEVCAAFLNGQKVEHRLV